MENNKESISPILAQKGLTYNEFQKVKSLIIQGSRIFQSAYVFSFRFKKTLARLEQ